MSTDPTDDLIHAVREGNVKTAKTLIATFGLCSSEKCSNGYYLLCEALRNKHEKMAEFLLKSGCSVNRKNNELSDTPLHLAVKNCYRQIVSMLLDREANINTRMENGRTALHIAASNIDPSAEELVKLLVNHGADIEVRDEDGLTPLHIATMGDDPVFTQTFLDLGANIEAKDKYGRTALHYAANNNNDEMIELMLNFDADPNATCKDSLLPFDYAVFSDLLNQEVLASKVLDLRVKDSHLKKILTDGDYDEIVEGMESEVADMKTEKIGDSNVTYFDFLTGGKNKLATYVGNESIVKGLEGTTKFGFCSYYRMIDRRWKNMKEIQTRQSLRSSSLKSLHVLSGYVLPDLPALEICEYLTIHEMEKLIKADPSAD